MPSMESYFTASSLGFCTTSPQARRVNPLSTRMPSGRMREAGTGSPKAASQAAASGALVGVVKSAQLGDSSVSYDTDALTRATADWGDLNATQYGQMLAARARLIGMGGSYVL